MAFWLFLILLVTLFFYYIYRRNKYFDSIGIKSPPALPFLGHLAEFASVPFGIKVQEWAKKYGKVFGIYEGGVPVLVVNDIDIVQDVFVKQYENFHARKHFPLAKNPDHDKYASMFTARGLRWKRIRTISNPVFKQSNLKRLCPLIDTASSDFMEILNEQIADGIPINLMINFQLFTADVIGRVAFGDENTQRPGTNKYYDFVREFFPDKPKFSNNILHLLPMVFPEIRTPISHAFHIYTSFKTNDPWYTLQTMVTDLVEKRRKEGPKSQESSDFIDLFLEVESSDILNIENESVKSDIKQQKIEKSILTEEIVGQLMLFLIAGYETTANSLSYVAYHLALNQECQEKVRNEMLSITGGTTPITQEMCSQMRYTEQCLKEALRLYPLASFVQARTCMKETFVGKDENRMKIPEGLVVLLDAWTIQRDKEFWGDDADEFRPERFDEINSEEVAKRYVPFGLGPRICIGMRFSVMEQKVLLAHILQNYRILPCEKTKIPIELRGAVTVVQGDLFLKFEPL